MFGSAGDDERASDSNSEPLCPFPLELQSLAPGQVSCPDSQLLSHFQFYLLLKGNGTWSQVSFVVIFNVWQCLIAFGSHFIFAINTLPVSGWLLQQHSCMLGSELG